MTILTARPWIRPIIRTSETLANDVSFALIRICRRILFQQIATVKYV